MKKLLTIIMCMLLIPSVLAVNIGSGITPDIRSEDFAPEVWVCESRVLLDDATEPGRVSGDGEFLLERLENYAFEGEQLYWQVLVFDKNGIEKVEDVYITVSEQRHNSMRQSSVTYCDSVNQEVPMNAQFELPKFDDSMGRLLSVELDVDANLLGHVAVENTDQTDKTLLLTSNATVHVDTVSGANLNLDLEWQDSVNLDSFDGLVDFAGDSGVTETVSDSASKDVSEAPNDYKGTGSVQFPVTSEGLHLIQGDQPYTQNTQVNTSASACVTYTYEYSIAPHIQANCAFGALVHSDEQINPTCNARILEEELTVAEYDNVMAYYDCTFTVETPDSMYGEHWVTVRAIDLDGLVGHASEQEYWFLNPVIALAVDGDLSFDNVRPGTSSYSESLLVSNDADRDSGVMLDMFIAGTDFYDSSSSGAKCPTSNQLSLSAFNYFAANGAFTTHFDARSDVEGYVPINYGLGFNDPNPFYNAYEIIQSPLMLAGYYSGNILTPGADLALTFRLNLPEPCNGDFDTGSIYFFGEAI